MVDMWFYIGVSFLIIVLAGLGLYTIYAERQYDQREALMIELGYSKLEEEQD